MSVSFRRFQWTLGIASLVLLIAGFAIVYKAIASPGGSNESSVAATILISRTPPHILDHPGATRERIEADYAIYRRTQASLVQNLRVLSHALAKPEVARLSILRDQADPEAWIAQNLKVDAPADSEIVQVSMEGANQEELAQIVNAVVASYMTVVVEWEKRERVARLDQLKALVAKYETDLKLKRQSLRELSLTVGLSDDATMKAGRERARQLIDLSRPELIRIQLEKVAAETKLARRKTKADPNANDLEAIAALEESVAVLTQQEKFLAEQETHLLKEEKVELNKGLDLANEREDIQTKTETLRRVLAEVEKVQIELNAPERIQILAKAKPRSVGR